MWGGRHGPSIWVLQLELVAHKQDPLVECVNMPRTGRGQDKVGFPFVMVPSFLSCCLLTKGHRSRYSSDNGHEGLSLRP
jgi:hypothetical protein